MRRIKLHETINGIPKDYNNIAYAIGKLASGESLTGENTRFWHYTNIGIGVIQKKLKNKRKFSKRSIAHCLRIGGKDEHIWGGYCIGLTSQIYCATHKVLQELQLVETMKNRYIPNGISMKEEVASVAPVQYHIIRRYYGSNDFIRHSTGVYINGLVEEFRGR